MSDAANIQIVINTSDAEKAEKVLAALQNQSDRLYQSLADLDKGTSFDRLNKAVNGTNTSMGKLQAANDSAFNSLQKTGSQAESAGRALALVDAGADNASRALVAVDTSSDNAGKALVAMGTQGVKAGRQLDASFDEVQKSAVAAGRGILGVDDATDAYAKGAGRASAATDKLAKSNSLAAKGFDYVKIAVVGAAVSLATMIRSASTAADLYKGMNDQLTIVTDSTEEFNNANTSLVQVAKDSRSQLSGVFDLYAATNQPLKELGFNQREIVDSTEAVTKSLKLGGGTAVGHAAALGQLIQALGSGVLRGEEFNSVMEGGRGLAIQLAKGLDVPIGSLRGMAEQGELTADVVVRALLKQKDAIDETFASLSVKSGEAWQAVSNSALLAIGKIDTQLGVSDKWAAGLLGFSAAIDLVADNLHVVEAGLTVVAAVIAGKLIAAGVAYIAQKATMIAIERAHMAALTENAVRHTALATGATAAAAAQAGAAASTRALGIAATASAAGMRLLSGAMALVGGPIGLIAAGVAVVVSYHKEIWETVNASAAAEKADRLHKEAIDLITKGTEDYADASEDARKAIAEAAMAEVLNANAKLNTLKVQAELLKVMNESNGSIREGTKATAQEVENATAAYNAQTARVEELQAKFDKFADVVAEAGKESKAAAGGTDALTEAQKELAKTMTGLASQTDLAEKAISGGEMGMKRYADSVRLAELELSGLSESEAFHQLIAENNLKTKQDIIAANLDVSKSIGDLTQENMLLTAEIEGNVEATERYIKSADGVTDELIKEEAALKATNAGLKEQKEIRDRVADGIESMAKQLFLHNIEMTQGSTAAAEAALQLEGYNEVQARGVVAAQEGMAAQREFKAALIDVFDSGSITEAAQTIEDYIKTWLRKLIADVAASKVMIMLGVGGASEAEGIFSGVIGKLKGLLGDAGSAADVATEGLGKTSDALEALGGKGADIATSTGGIFDNLSTGLKAFKADLVAAAGPLAIVAGAYGVMRSAMGGKTTAVGSGVELSVSGGDVSGQNYTDYEKKRSLWRGTDRWTDYSELDSEVEAGVSSYFKALNRSVAAGAKLLGVAGADSILDNFDVAITRIQAGDNFGADLSGFLEKSTNDAYAHAFVKLSPSMQRIVGDGLGVMEKPVMDAAGNWTVFADKWEEGSNQLTGAQRAHNAAIGEAKKDYAAATEAWEKNSELLGEAMQAAIEKVQAMNPALTAMGFAASMTNEQVVAASIGIVDAFGSAEDATAFMTLVLGELYTGAEIAANNLVSTKDYLKQFNDELGLSGAAMIDTRAEARDYIETLIEKKAAMVASNVATEEEIAAIDAEIVASGNLVVAVSAVEDARLAEVAALEQAAAVHSQVTAIMAGTNDTIFQTGEQASAANNRLAEMAGGFDALQSKQSNYMSKFFSDEEIKAQALAKAAGDVMDFNNALGLTGDAVIDTKDEFRDYMAGLDRTTEAGNRAYLAGLDVASSMGLIVEEGGSLNETIGALPENLQALGQGTVAFTATAATAFGELSSELGLTGSASIKTQADLLAFVTGLDLTTEAGQQAHSAITAFADGQEASLAMTKSATDGLDAFSASVGLTGADALLSRDQLIDFATGIDTSTEAGKLAQERALLLAAELDGLADTSGTSMEGINAIRDALGQVQTPFAAFSEQVGLTGASALTSEAEIRAFVEGLDLSTEKGRTAYEAVVAMSESMALNAEAANLNKAAISEFSDSIGLTGESALTGRDGLAEFIKQQDLSTDAGLSAAMAAIEVSKGLLEVDENALKNSESLGFLVESLEGHADSGKLVKDRADELTASLTEVNTAGAGATAELDAVAAAGLATAVASEALEGASLSLDGQLAASAEAISTTAISFGESSSYIDASNEFIKESVTGMSDSFRVVGEEVSASSVDMSGMLEALSSTISVSSDTLAEASLSMSESSSGTVEALGTLTSNVTEFSAASIALSDSVSVLPENTNAAFALIGEQTIATAETVTASAGVIDVARIAANESFAMIDTKITETGGVMTAQAGVIEGATGAANGALSSFASAIHATAAAANSAAGVAAGAASAAQSAAGSASSYESNAASAAYRAAASASSAAGSAWNATQRLNAISVDGSHSGGLPYVPFDGYIGELHEGERVLTKQENREYSSVNSTVTNNNTSTNNNAELIAEMRAVRAEIAKARQEANRNAQDNNAGLGAVVAGTYKQVSETQALNKTTELAARKKLAS